MSKHTGVLISFSGMSFKNRLVVWWMFTLACFFRKNVDTGITNKVTSITIGKNV